MRLIGRLALCIFVCAAASPTVAQGPEKVVVQVLGKTLAPPQSADGPIFAYSGGVWQVPRTFGVIAPRILELQEIGTVRAALAWEVLAASQSAEDLELRLRDYRLNDFLRQVVARGGRVMITLDAMPRWLAADRSDARLPDGPAWAKSAPRDFGTWRKVVESVVRHFNGRLGLNAGYEIWNEPDHAFRGTLEQYFALYRASVAGALAADPNAKIGGPGISDWTARGTRPTPGSYQEGLFLQRFFAYAAKTPLPEFGKQRLPVDFVTWHSFYRDPTRHYEFIVPRVRAWLESAGYPHETPLVISEWNIAAEPPYPEGDLNGGHVGAAYTAATLIAMHQSGIAAQVFQMMVDPGGEGYSGGTFTYAGLPRPNFNAFRLAARLEGRVLQTTTSDSWVRGIASIDNGHLYVLLANFVPTEMTLLRSSAEPIAALNPDTAAVIERVDRQALAAFFRQGHRLPAGVSETQLKVLDAARARYLEGMKKASQWRSGATVEIRLPPELKVRGAATSSRIDAQHSVNAQRMAEINKSFLAELQRFAESHAQDLRRRGGPGLEKNFLSQLQRDFGMGPISAAHQNEVRALEDAFRKFHAEYQSLLAATTARSELQLGSDTVQVTGGTLSVALPPNAVHLLVIPVAR